MNILLTFLNAKKNAFGGMEKSIFSFISGFTNRKDKLFVYTAKNGQSEENFLYSEFLNINLNVPVQDIDKTILRYYHEHNEEISREIYKIIQIKKIDYILIIDQLWGIIPHIKFSSDLKCKIGILYHMYFDSQKGIMQKTFDLRFDNYFAVSEDVRISIYKNCIKHPQIDILPNAYNPKEFYDLNLKRQNYIFCNSRLVKEKGILELIEALKYVHARGFKIHLVLCGDEFCFGSNSDIHKYICQQKNINSLLGDYIHVLKNIIWAQIPSIICQSQMVVLPTQYESFGIAALEAMACGTPLITTNVGNLPHLVGRAGLLSPFGDINKLGESIIKVLQDIKLQEKMKSNELDRAKRYQCDIIVDRFLENIINDKKKVH